MDLSKRFPICGWLSIIAAVNVLLVACGSVGGSVTSDALSLETPVLDAVRPTLAGVVSTFIGDVIDSATDGHEDDPEIQRALSRLPKSVQAQVTSSDYSSVHKGLLNFLQLNDVPDRLLSIEVLEEDPLTKEAKAEITLVFGELEERRTLELERIVCGFAWSDRERDLSAGKECQARNLKLYGDEEPWRITNASIS